ncbi:hypothetical protein [Streptomyces sp. NPDC056663]|uniref:hypothetical protein n=1 Tax=Streptomyces sp. NPDC056663 TaxID=3345899 RepID=UPI0036AE3749
MASKRLAGAERLGNDAKLKTLPQLRKAAKKVAKAVDVLMGTALAPRTARPCRRRTRGRRSRR